MKMVYLPTGQEIMFKGCDDPQKSKSIKPKKGYFGYCWFEEATDFQGLDEIENIVQSVARSGLGKTAIFLSYNPPQSVQSWINAEVLRPQQNRFIHHSTYLSIRPDLLGEQFIKIAEYKKQTNEKQYNHIYLGEVTGTGGEVFDNVESREITDREIDHFDYLYTGLDFGFAVDPVAIVKASYNSSKKELYIFDEFYRVGASFDVIADQLQKMGNPYTIADSAEPRSIYELKKRDCRIVGAKKGSGSVEHGLKCLQDLNKIVIDPARCPNTIREFCTYEYELDKYGNYKSIYPDKNNHSIDATRYALEDIFRDNNIYSM
jgi:PBSX family phage terminase large subunit